MEFEEFKQILIKESKKIKIIITDDIAKKLYNYMCNLLEWNKKINLTAITNPNDIIIKHFIDSFTINTYINRDTSLIDIGTGAGFPGIPIAILREDLKITLVDSLQKRINFLNDVICKLELKNVIAIHSRAEEIGQDFNYREKFDIATSRAVTNMSTLAEYMIPFIKKDGICICMKGANVDEELKNCDKAVRVLGGRLEKREEFFLLNKENKRNIIIIRKVRSTPNEYPRKQIKILKEPIK